MIPVLLTIREPFQFRRAILTIFTNLLIVLVALWLSLSTCNLIILVSKSLYHEVITFTTSTKEHAYPFMSSSSYFENRAIELESALNSVLEHFDPGIEGTSWTTEAVNGDTIAISDDLSDAIDHANAVLYEEEQE